MKKLTVFIFSIVIIFGAIFVINQEIRNPTIVERPMDPLSVYALECQIIRVELDEYEDLSASVKNQIAGSILEASNEYNVPPGLLHAIFQIESEYRFNVIHAPIVVKGKKTAAIGLGGIVWEYWSKELIGADIAEKKSDLYIPRINIVAAAYILRDIIDEELQRKSTEKSNIISRIIIQYYGARSIAYENKMKMVTSNLWLKRMSRELASKKNFDDTVGYFQSVDTIKVSKDSIFLMGKDFILK